MQTAPIAAGDSIAQVDRSTRPWKTDPTGESQRNPDPALRRVLDQQSEQLTAPFVYPTKIRKIVSTTNAIEPLNVSMRRILRTRRAFPHDERRPSGVTWPAEHGQAKDPISE
jgi:hypothetical protein